jgi:hypothetical protein
MISQKDRACSSRSRKDRKNAASERRERPIDRSPLSSARKFPANQRTGPRLAPLPEQQEKKERRQGQDGQAEDVAGLKQVAGKRDEDGRDPDPGRDPEAVEETLQGHRGDDGDERDAQPPGNRVGPGHLPEMERQDLVDEQAGVDRLGRPQVGDPAEGLEQQPPPDALADIAQGIEEDAEGDPAPVEPRDAGQEFRALDVVEDPG